MKIIICKDDVNNKLLEVRELQESDNIKYHVIEDAPEIETRDKEQGHYELNEAGDIVVVYEPMPQTMEEKLEEQERIIADLMLEMAIMQQGGKK